MKSIAAINLEIGKDLVVDEIEIPDPRPDQVVVKLSSSGVCHSQLHQIHQPDLPRPWMLGHEGTGVVTHIGSSVNHVKEGDTVIVTWVPRTPVKGRPTSTLSGVTYREEPVNGQVYTWGEDVLLNEQYVVPIDKKYPADVTCIVGCAILTGAGAVLNTAKVRPGDSVVVYGVGGVGLSAIQMASILEAYPIIAVDLDDQKLEFAKEFGATHFVNALNTEPIEAVLEITNGGADYAFDAIGVKATNEQILPSVRGGAMGAANHGGTAVLIGIPNQSITIDPSLFVRGQRTYRGSLGATYPEKDFELFLRWYEEGKFPLDKMITKRYSLAQINEACHDLESGEIFGRAILEY